MPPDLLVLLCDTARADAFGPWAGFQRTPAVETMCAQGTVYSRAVAPAPWTLPSIASLLTGRLPTEHRITGDSLHMVQGRPGSPGGSVRAYAGPWLPEQLRERGYRTWAASCNPWISTWGGFDRGFHDFHVLRGMAGTRARRLRRILTGGDSGGRRAIDEFRRALATQGPEPLFAFVNLMEVHGPYDPPFLFHPALDSKLLRREGVGRYATLYCQLWQRKLRRRGGAPGLVPAIRSLYYSAARYEDWLIGRFMRAVQERGRPSVIVLVADHGENLGDHGLFGHQSSLHETLLHVPLSTWGYRVELGSGRVEDPVSLLSLSSWLRRVADGEAAPISPNGPIVSEYESTARHMRIPAELRGQIEERGEDSIPELVFHAGIAVRRDRFKYVAAEGGGEALYDLEADRNEERSIIDEHPEVLEEVRPIREAWATRRAAAPASPPPPEDVADSEIADHLRTLGYID